MSTIYLLVDSSNIIQAAYASVPQSLEGYSMDGVDSTAPNALAALTAPGGTYSYVNGVITRVPWFSVAYGSGTLTATLDGYTGSSLPTVSFEVAGNTFAAQAASVTQTIGGVAQTAQQATVALVVDPSAQSAQVPVTVSASGFVTAQTNLGGLVAIPIKTVTPSAGTPTVVPLNQTDYADYWAAQLPPGPTLLQMLAAFQHLATDMTLAGSMPSTLDANQQATWNDVLTNVRPHLVLTLETAQTTGAGLYAQAKQTLDQFAAANASYLKGVEEYYA